MEDKENVLKMLEDTKPLLETWMHNQPDEVGLRFSASSSHSSKTTENFSNEHHSTGLSEGSNGEIEEHHLDVTRTENEICFVDLQPDYTFECSSLATDNIQGVSCYVDPLCIDSTAECETSLNRSNTDCLKATERTNLPDNSSFESSLNVAYADRQLTLNVVQAACENDLHSLTVMETGSNVAVDESEDAIEILAMSLNQTIDVEKLVLVEFDESPEISDAPLSAPLEVVENTADYSLILNLLGENNDGSPSAPLQVVHKIVDHSLISSNLMENNDGALSAPLQVVDKIVDHSLISNNLIENNDGSLNAPLQVVDKIVDHSLFSNNLIENIDGSLSAPLQVVDKIVNHSLISNNLMENNDGSLSAPLQIVDKIVYHSLISNNLIENNDGSLSAPLQVVDKIVDHSLPSNNLIENNDGSLSAPFQVVDKIVNHSLISNNLIENNDGSLSAPPKVVDKIVDHSLISNDLIENNDTSLGVPLQVVDQIVDHSLISNNLIENNDGSVGASLEVVDNTLYHSLISNDLIENNDTSLSALEVENNAVEHSLISKGLLENNDASDTGSKNILEQLINERNTLYNEVSMLHIRAEKVRKNIAQTDESILAQVLEIEANEEKLKKYSTILKEYELLPCIQDKDEAMVMKQSKALQKRLSEADIRLSFVLQKYGKTQSLIDTLRRNEEISITNKKNLESQLLDLQNKCQSIEDKFKSSKMCQERHEQEKEKYKKRISKQEALIKILKIKALSLETAIEQKSQECKAIAALCEVLE